MQPISCVTNDDEWAWLVEILLDQMDGSAVGVVVTASGRIRRVPVQELWVPKAQRARWRI